MLPQKVFACPFRTYSILAVADLLTHNLILVAIVVLPRISAAYVIFFLPKTAITISKNAYHSLSRLLSLRLQ